MSCGCLKSSQGEFKIAKILDEANINYKREYVFSDLITEKGGYARFDFAIFKNDTLLYLIEYDGETHSKKHASGWNTIEKIEYQKKCDALKTEYCKKHCIPLIRIPYTKFQTLTLNDLILHEEF